MRERVNHETARERQKRVAKSGEEWEKYVKFFLEEKLKDSEIEILKESKARDNRKLVKLLSLPTGLEEEHIWDDVDLLAVKNNLPITVINCKSSIHGRYSFYFWGLLFCIHTKVKFIVATPDAGRGQEKWVSEWGTPQEPTKFRTLAERYIDGIYVQNVKQFCKNIKEGQGTAFGGIVRPLEELPEDIKRWNKDLKFIPKRSRKNYGINFF